MDASSTFAARNAMVGALLIASGELRDPFPPSLQELARRYFEAYPPEVKA